MKCMHRGTLLGPTIIILLLCLVICSMHPKKDGTSKCDLEEDGKNRRGQDWDGYVTMVITLNTNSRIIGVL